MDFKVKDQFKNKLDGRELSGRWTDGNDNCLKNRSGAMDFKDQKKIYKNIRQLAFRFGGTGAEPRAKAHRRRDVTPKPAPAPPTKQNPYYMAPDETKSLLNLKSLGAPRAATKSKIPWRPPTKQNPYYMAPHETKSLLNLKSLCAPRAAAKSKIPLRSPRRR